MKKLKLDGRTDEERMMEELALDKEESKEIVLEIQGDSQDGIQARPQVRMVIPAQKKVIAPK